MKTWDVDYLKKATPEDAVQVMKHAQDQRAVHRHHNNGYTKDRSMRYLGSFDARTLFHPEFKKFFDTEMDTETRRKEMYKFLRKFDLAGVDRL